MASVNLPPPPPLQFLKPESSSEVNWNWHDWFYRLQSLSAGVSTTPNTLVMPAQFTVTGNNSPTITVTWASESANTLLASPNGSSGAPTFRKIVPGDYPWPQVKKSILTSEVLTILSGYELTVHNTFTVSGILNLNGQIYLE